MVTAPCSRISFNSRAPIITHAGKDDADAILPRNLRRTRKGMPNGGTVAIDQRPLGHCHVVPPGISPQGRMVKLPGAMRT